MDDKEKKLALMGAFWEIFGLSDDTYYTLKACGITHGEMEEVGMDLREHYVFESDEIDLQNQRQ